MWNKIACNPLCQKRTQLKQQERHLKQLRTTKSTFNIPEARRQSYHSKSKFTLNEQYLNIDKENSHLLKRIMRAKSMRSLTSLGGLSEKSKVLAKNRQRQNELKAKQLREENQKILKRLLKTESSLKKFRVKTCQNDYEYLGMANRGKTLITASGNSQFMKNNSLLKMKTEAASEVISRVEIVPHDQMPEQQIQME